MNEDEILQGATPIAHRVDDNVSDVVSLFTFNSAASVTGFASVCQLTNAL